MRLTQSRRTVVVGIAGMACFSAVACITRDLALTSCVGGLVLTTVSLVVARHTAADMRESANARGGEAQT